MFLSRWALAGPNGDQAGLKDRKPKVPGLPCFFFLRPAVFGMQRESSHLPPICTPGRVFRNAGKEGESDGVHFGDGRRVPQTSLWLGAPTCG